MTDIIDADSREISPEDVNVIELINFESNRILSVQIFSSSMIGNLCIFKKNCHCFTFETERHIAVFEYEQTYILGQLIIGFIIHQKIFFHIQIQPKQVFSMIPSALSHGAPPSTNKSFLKCIGHEL